MSRRRLDKQAEATVFLDANPTLIEFETHIEVAQNDTGRHVLAVTVDDEDTVLTEAPQLSVPDLVSITGDIEGPNFELDAFTTFRWFGQEREGRGYVALSDLGIGVSSTKDFINIGFQALQGDLEFEDIQKVATASPNEALRLAVDEVPHESGDGPALDHGGKSIEIDFDVVSGEGTVQIVLTDDETGQETVYEFETEVPSGRGRGTELVDSLQAIMGENTTFEEVEIRTTGDLEINVVGIDMTTGYVELADVI